MKHFAAPAYGVAVLLVALPLVDTLLGALPLRPSEVSWRFGVLGLVSRTVLSPLMGLLIALGVALLRSDRRALQFLALFSGMAATAVVPLIALFALDTLQMRTQLVPGAASQFDTTVTATFVKYGITFLMLALFTVSSWKASRRAAHVAYERSGLKKDSLPGLLVR